MRPYSVMLLASYTLWLREVVRFYRQPSRIIGALGSPVVFWLLIGSGLGRSFQAAPGAVSTSGYLEYFYPGTLVLIVLFTAIFSTISVIEDRQQGFLQGVLAAPVSRMTIVLGKVSGGTTLAMLQAVVFLGLAPFASTSLRLSDVPALLGVLTLVAFGLTGLGFLIAWHLDSTQGFHAIMNLFLIPMWILSGALFPAYGAARWVRVLMFANPLTYGLAAVRTIFHGGSDPLPGDPRLVSSLTVTALFAVLMLVSGAISVEYRRA